MKVFAHFLLLVCLIPSCFCVGGCVFLTNTRVNWDVFTSQGIVNLIILEPEEFKWHAVGFNSLHGDLKNGSIIFMRVENQVHLYKGIGKDKQPEWIQSLNATIEPVEFTGYTKGLYFTFPINNTIFESEDTIRIFAAGNTEEAPKSPTEFPMHTWTQIREIQLDTDLSCGTFRSRVAGANVLAVNITMIVFWLLISIICFALRNRQPLKSRGYIPVLISFSQAIAFVANIIVSPSIISYELQTKFSCILFHLIFTPNRLIAPLVITIHVLRFVLIINLNNMKDTFMKQQQAKAGAIRKVKILKILTAPWFSIATIVSILSLAALIGFIEMAIFNFHCENVVTLGRSSVFWAAVYVILLIAGIAELLYDIYLNRYLNCNIWKFYVSNDAYKYRMELHISIVISTLWVLFGVLVTFMPISYIIDAAIYTTFSLLFTFTHSIAPLCLTIWREIRKRIRKKYKKQEDGDSIDRLLHDETTRPLFEEFAKQEWSTENIMIYVCFSFFILTLSQDDIKKYKRISNPEEKLKMLKDIYEKYLNGRSSAFEVNIDRTTCQEVAKLIAEGKADDTSLEKVENVVKLNLDDTCSRFITSDAYMTYLKGVEAQKKLMKKSGIF